MARLARLALVPLTLAAVAPGIAQADAAVGGSLGGIPLGAQPVSSLAGNLPVKGLPLLSGLMNSAGAAAAQAQAAGQAASAAGQGAAAAAPSAG